MGTCMNIWSSDSNSASWLKLISGSLSCTYSFFNKTIPYHTSKHRHAPPPTPFCTHTITSSNLVLPNGLRWHGIFSLVPPFMSPQLTHVPLKLQCLGLKVISQVLSGTQKRQWSSYSPNHNSLNQPKVVLAYMTVTSDRQFIWNVFSSKVSGPPCRLCAMPAPPLTDWRSQMEVPTFILVKGSVARQNVPDGHVFNGFYCCCTQ